MESGCKSEHLFENLSKGSYELPVLDIFQKLQVAGAGQILAAATLIRDYPPPVLRIAVGFFSIGSIRYALSARDPRRSAGERIGKKSQE